ncbi:XRE family transcriptional regulator [Kitasatospora sp. NPDC056651]|uniref:XRE family transcriptional regulator n=1 Tax=Kitasatospora sp. NPDC056651 TaxID=3345892 RepID=UPI0036A33845
MGDNRALRQRMLELDINQVELAHRVNITIETITGRYGTCSERTVRDWMNGKATWPRALQRRALEEVFDCTAEDLGFKPRGATPAPPPTENDVMKRQTFLKGIAATAAAGLTSPPAATASRTTIGTSDVIRLRGGLETLDALDDRKGGHGALEKAALAYAEEVMNLQRTGSATERIRLRLYSVAADYTAIAAWSCIDARELDRAQLHLDACMRLAGLARDPVAAFRTWNMIAMLANQLGNYPDAIAAARAAQRTGITRRDPAFASLAHARTAIGSASLGDRQSALRSIGLAADALGRARDDRPCPSWFAFYGAAELQALTSIVHDRLGDAVSAESASHQALALLPVQFRRNRALATARLALTLLHQDELDLAVHTASSVFDIMAGGPLPGRMRTLLGDFHRELLTLSTNVPAAQEWGDRYRTEWSRM